MDKKSNKLLEEIRLFSNDFNVLIFVFFLSTNTLAAQQFGVILSNQTVIKSKPNISAKNITKILKNQVVEILELSEQQVILRKDDPCEEYPWIKIKYKNKIGWILGKYIFRLLENDKKLPNFEISLDNQSYQLVSARNYGHGFVKYDAKGNYMDTYGCPEFYVVGLWAKSSNKVIFFQNSSKIKHTNEYFLSDFWGIFNDNGMKERIVEVSIKDSKTLLCKVVTSLQEGCIQYQLALQTTTPFSIELIDYQKYSEDNCQ